MHAKWQTETLVQPHALVSSAARKTQNRQSLKQHDKEPEVKNTWVEEYTTRCLAPRFSEHNSPSKQALIPAEQLENYFVSTT